MGAIGERTQPGYVQHDPMSAPYHGYDYKILTGQGKDAPGGAYDYMVGGKMIGALAFNPDSTWRRSEDQ